MKRAIFSLLFLATTLSLLAEAPRWAVRVHPAVLAGLDYADMENGTMSPGDIVEKLKTPDFANQLGSFLDLCRRQGISEIVLDGVQPEIKGIYFRSPELESAGWAVLADVLGNLRAEAAKRDMRVGLNLSELGIHARGLYDEDEYGLQTVKKLSPAGLEAVFRDLAGSYGVASLNEEEFPSEWFQPLLNLSQSLRFSYVHLVSADDIATFVTGNQKTTPLNALPQSLVLSTRDVDPLLASKVEAAVTNGSLPLMLSSGKLAVEVSDVHQGRLFLEGDILFRALQAAPERFTLEASRDTLARLTPGLVKRAEDLAQQHDSAPLLDLIVLGAPRGKLDSGQIAWLQLAANLEPLSLAFGAAGFQVRMTNRVLPDARAYYVYLAGDAHQEWAECQAALEKATGSVPVFVQLGSEPQKPLVDELTRFFGWRSASWVKSMIPPIGLYKGREMTYKGPDLYQGHIPAGYLQLAVDPRQVLMADGSGNPLITASSAASNRHFVNSNLIHRDVAYPLSQLLSSGRGLQRPAACFIAVGKKTAFWALADTEVEWVHPRTGERLVLEMKKGGFHVE